MASSEHRDAGVLFINRDHAKNPKSPNLKGTGRIAIDGKEYELDLAAWTRESERAGKFLSVSIKLKGEGRTAAKSTRPQQPQADGDPAW
jgi:hypothetical protein